MSMSISSSTGSIVTQKRYQRREETRAPVNRIPDLRHRTRTWWFGVWELDCAIFMDYNKIICIKCKLVEPSDDAVQSCLPEVDCLRAKVSLPFSSARFRNRKFITEGPYQPIATPTSPSTTFCDRDNPR